MSEPYTYSLAQAMKTYFYPKNANYRRWKLIQKDKKKKNYLIHRAYEMRNNPTASEEEAFGLLKVLNWQETFYRQSVQGKYILDFFYPQSKVAVELDGISHQGREYHDWKRDRQLKELGIVTLRFPSDIVFTDPSLFQDQILHILETRTNAESSSTAHR